MITQKRRTGGIRLVGDYGAQIHIDPGPGALVYSNLMGLNPQDLDGIIISHSHPDHYSDAEVFIEAMTRGTRVRRGVLAAPCSVLYGSRQVGPSISNYHRRLPERVEELSVGHKFSIRDLKFEAVKALHSDPYTVGLKIHVPRLGLVGYTSDTNYFPELGDLYRGCRLLIMCIMWPRNIQNVEHLSIDDALKVLLEARPEQVILTHFGMTMLRSNPDIQARYLEEESGIPVLAARDGLKVSLGEGIGFGDIKSSL
jgi:phosphoribosyl 1,2-cyclic phosphodiesterase